MQTNLKMHWWQRHPFVGLVVGWAAIVVVGVDLIGYAFSR